MSEEATAVSTETAPVVPAVETGEAPDKPTAEKPAEAPPRTYSQEEMDRITAKVKKNAAYRAKKEAEAFYKGLQQGSANAKPADAKPAAPAEERAPVREDFPNLTYEEFLEKKADFVGRKAAREERINGEREEKSRKASEARAKIYQDFQSKVRTDFPDIEDRLADIGHINLPDGMGDAIAESAIGPQILNHLADNPKDCERIAALSPSAAIREIGKLEARLEAKAQEKPAPKSEPKAEAEEEAEPEPKTKPSKAPEPIKPVGGKSTEVNAEPDPSKNGGKDWVDWRNRQEYARRTGTK